MTTVDLRKDVLDYIKNKADTKFLRLVKAMANTYAEEEEIAERDTVDQYTKDINESIEEIKNREFYTQEEVKKIANKW